MKSYPRRMMHASGKTMELVQDKILVCETSPPSATSATSALGLVPDSIGAAVHRGAVAGKPSGRPMQRINAPQGRTWMRTKDGSPFDPAAAAGASIRGLVWLGPVYRLLHGDRDEYLCPLPHVLLIKRNRMTKPDALTKLLAGLGLAEVPEKSRYLGKYAYFEVLDPLKVTALELMEKLRDEHATLIDDVRFETMPMVAPTAFIPDDTLYPDQWDMEQINAGGAGQTGWNLERGDTDVIICVLDEGCELGHQDLQFVHDGINLGTMLPTGAPTGNHGTACAGIAAADIDNNEGIAGVAGQCRILPVAFDAWTDAEVAAGIRYAADEGAHVISMSFGWDPWDPAIIDPAIQDAFDANVVMCVATHNYDTQNGITYPATNPLVIAVGASDQVDDRKSPTSPDGEWWWGSNYGPEISVVAPGVLCPTTDRLGAAGYNTSGGAAGDYVMDFNGTSAATPHVAGLAALLFSRDSSLSNVEIRDCIETTAAKVGTAPYATDPNYPNGTWNEEMGYGRIDVEAALTCASKSILSDIKHSGIDRKLLVLDKHIHQEVIEKRTGPKEKERLDEVKGLIGYENPLIIDHRILVMLEERLAQLEHTVEGRQGRAFVTPRERPQVGSSIPRGARRGCKK